MNISTFLPHLKSLPSYQDQIVHIEHITSQDAKYADLEEPINQGLLSSLESNKLLPLYKHQAIAINAILKGKNVVVVTPTASGKTLCYNVPVLDAILSKKGNRALYLFPT